MTGDPASSDGGESPVVRRYRPRDAEAIRRLHRRALRAAGTDPDDVPGTEDLADVEAAYLDAGGEFLVAEADGDVVAMGGLAVDESAKRVNRSESAGELFRVAVDPDRQREGYGTAVLDGLEAAARERGLDSVVLTTARRQRAATEFYAARGYREIGREREGEYELIRFEKALDAGGGEG